MFAGYFLVWLSVQKWIWSSFIMLSIYHALIGHGSIAAYTSALKTSVKNWDLKHRGKVSDFKGWRLKVGGDCRTCSVDVWFECSCHYPNVLLGVCSQLFKFFALLGDSTSGGMFYMCSISPNCGTKSGYIHTSRGKKTGSSELIEEGQFRGEGRLESVNHIVLLGIVFHSNSAKWDRLGILNVVLIMKGKLFQANVGSIVESYGHPKGSQHILVTITSISSSIARIGSGIAVDVFAKKYSVPTLIFCTCLLTLAYQIYCIFAVSYNALYLISAVSGVCFGATLSLLPTHVSKEWGTKNFATNWSLLFPAIMVGSFLLGSLLPGLIYDSQLKEGQKECIGVWCFRYSFIISSGINVVCTLLALLLAWMHRRKQKAKLFDEDVVKEEKEKVQSNASSIYPSE